MAIDTKLVLSKKDMTLWTVPDWDCNKEEGNSNISRSVSEGKNTDISTVSQHGPRREKCWIW